MRSTPNGNRSNSEPAGGVVRLEPARATVRMLTISGLALVALHLVLVFRYQTSSQLGITMICWYGAGALAVKDWGRLNPSSSWAARLGGWLLLGVAWSSGVWMTDAREKFLFVYPLLGGVGLGLIAAGFRGLCRYWRELTILFCLGIPRGFITEWIDLSGPTAKLAAFVLWYLGRDVRLVGTEIQMPGGAVDVDKGCDGSGVISYLLCLAVVFVFLFQVHGAKRVWALIIAPVLAFITNMARVLVLALMEAAGRHDAFEYWHVGSGSIVWTVLPVVLFGLVSLLLLRSIDKEPDDIEFTKDQARFG